MKKGKEKPERKRSGRMIFGHILCLILLLALTAGRTAAEEMSGSGIHVPADAAGKKLLTIVLRPEKQEGEPDPDLGEEIRRQIRDQLEAEEKEPEEGKGEETVPAVMEEGPESGAEEEIVPDGPAGEPGEEGEETARGDPETTEGKETENKSEPEENGENADGSGSDTDGYEENKDVETNDPGPVTAEDREALLDRLCACVTWSYPYDENVLPPGENRPAGKAEITLQFAEDPEYCFEAGSGEEGRSFLTTVPAEKPGQDNAGEREEKDEDPDAGGGEAEDSGDGSEPGEETCEDGSEEPGEQGDTGTEPDTGKDGTAGSGTAGEDEPAPEPAGGRSDFSETEIPVPAEIFSPWSFPAEILPAGEETRARSREAAGTEAGVKIPAVPQITLTHTGSRGETDLTAEYREILNGTSPEKIDWPALLADTPENDGIYTYRAVYTDDSGRPQTEEVTFSVNRYGSVYIYNDLIRKLQGRTVRQVEGPLIISEYSPEKLTAGSARVELLRDGEKVSGVRYTVEEKENTQGGYRAGWYRYDYVVAPENFLQDGVYRLTALSDTAEIHSESHAYNGGTITFAVDAAPPELQMVKILESDAAEGRKITVTMTVFDAMELGRVDLYANGKRQGSLAEFPDRNRAEISFTAAAEGETHIRIVVSDAAGNVLDTDAKDEKGNYLFQPEYPFGRDLTADPEAEDPVWKRSLYFLLAAIAAAAGAGFILFMKRQGFDDEEHGAV